MAPAFLAHGSGSVSQVVVVPLALLIVHGVVNEISEAAEVVVDVASERVEGAGSAFVCFLNNEVSLVSQRRWRWWPVSFYASTASSLVHSIGIPVCFALNSILSHVIFLS